MFFKSFAQIAIITTMIKRYLILLAFLIAACTSSVVDEFEYDPNLRDFDQTGWACDHPYWNVWFYYENFEIETVNTVFHAVDDSAIWSKKLPEAEPNFYQLKFFDFSRQCQPYNVEYTVYFSDKEPESYWMYWNDNEIGNEAREI